jgi:hypothetical protein
MIILVGLGVKGEGGFGGEGLEDWRGVGDEWVGRGLGGMGDSGMFIPKRTYIKFQHIESCLTGNHWLGLHSLE